MPAGDDATLPAPRNVTSSACGPAPNVAVTFFDASTVSVQVLLPLHAPDQPVNTEPAAAVAVSVTEVPNA